MKTRKLTICIMLLLLLSFGMTLFTACSGDVEKPEEITIKIEVSDRYDVPVGEYNIPYEIDDDDELISKYAMVVKIKVTDNVGKDVVVTENKSFVVEKGKKYVVEITVELNTGKTSKKAFSVVAVGSSSVTTYIVEFFIDNLSFKTVPVSENSPLPQIIPTEKTGYTFSHWYLVDDTTQKEYNSPVTSHLSLKAKYNLIEYVATFDPIGGAMTSLTETTDCTKEYKVSPNTPTKKGYSFLYWFATGDATETKIDLSNYVLSANASFTAKYSMDTYTVSFTSDKPTVTRTTNISSNFLVTPPENPTKDYYIFNGWLKPDETLVADFANEKFMADTTLVADYTPVTISTEYYILNKENEPVLFDTTLTQKRYDFKAIKPNVLPAKEYYVLSGWYILGDADKTLFDFNTVLSEKISLVALFDEQTFSVTFDDKKDEIDNETRTTSISKSFKIDRPDNPMKDGYTFLHWYLSDGDANDGFDFAKTEVKSDLVLLAQYKAIEITVTFIAKNPATNEVLLETTAKTDITKGYLVTPKRDVKCEGFVLGFYYSYYQGVDQNNPTEFNFAVNPVTDGAVFYAKMNTVEYKVQFYDKNSNTSPYTPLGSIVHNASFYGVPLKALSTWTHYDTKGWVANSSGIGELWTNNTKIYASMLIDGVLKLYSVRTATEYNVSFIYYDENNAEIALALPRIGTVNGLLDRTLPTTIVRPDYTFVYWYAMIGGKETKIDAAYMQTMSITSDMKIIAKYRRAQCRVLFYKNLGDIEPLAQKSYDSDYILKSSDFPVGSYTKEGYVTNVGIWGRLSGDKLIPVEVGYQLKTNENLYLIWQLIEHKIKVIVNINGELREFDTTTSIEKNNLFVNPEYEISQNPDIYQFTQGRKLFGLYRSYNATDGYTDAFSFANTKITADITLYAEYVVQNINLYFYNETTEISSVVVPYNSSYKTHLPNITEYKKDKHTTLGWYIHKNNDITSEKISLTEEYMRTNYITGDMNIYVDYTPVQHTITLQYGNGEPNSTLIATFETNYILTAPTAPMRRGYLFDGWKLGSTSFAFDKFRPIDENVAENITITASWKLITYSVTLDPKNGNAPTIIIVDYTTDYKIPTNKIPTTVIDGYNFTGWKLNDSYFDITSAIKSNVTLMADYSIIKHNVTFLYEDGSTFTVRIGTIIGIEGVMPSITKTHYIFIGWFDRDGINYVSNSQYIKDGLALSPRFEAKVYTVTFDTGLAAIKPPPHTTDITKDFLIDRPSVSISTKILENWYFVKVGNEYSEPYDFHTAINKDVTLYAKWRDKTNVETYFTFEDYHIKKYSHEGNIIWEQYKALTGLTEDGKLLLDLLIPSEIGGIPVGEIRANSFVGSKSKTISINSKMTINVGAFTSARELESIYINYNDMILPFNDSLFIDCMAITNIYVPQDLLALYAERYEFQNSMLSSIDEYGNELVILNNVTYLLTKHAAFVKDYPKNIISKSVTIPSMVYGKPVIEIMNNAFEGAQFNTILLPNTLRKIGNYAFQNCLELDTIRIPSLVVEIGELAFGFCPALQTLFFDSGTPPIINGQIFSGSTELLSIFTPEDLVAKYKAALVHYDMLVKSENNANTVVIYVTLGGNPVITEYYDMEVTITPPTPIRYGYIFTGWFLDKEAILNMFDFTKPISYGSKILLYAGWVADKNILFVTNEVKIKNQTGFTTELMIVDLTDYCIANLTEITIPYMINGKKVTYIHSKAFFKSKSLSKIMVAAENTSFIAIDGVLFTATSVGDEKQANALLHYPVKKIIEGTSSVKNIYTVPTGVKMIEQYAFYKNCEIVTVKIPDSVEIIGAYAFSGCGNLTEVTFLGKSRITEIAHSTFAQCKNLVSFIVPELVVKIDTASFYNCVNMLSIEFTAKDAPFVKIAQTAFALESSSTTGEKMKINTIILPTGTLEKYAEILTLIAESAEKNSDPNFKWNILYK